MTKEEWNKAHEGLGEALHVYFRKFDDCPTSMPLWNAITDEDHWSDAIEFAIDHLYDVYECEEK
jgi:hypothetical protein